VRHQRNRQRGPGVVASSARIGQADFLHFTCSSHVAPGVAGERFLLLLLSVVRRRRALQQGAMIVVLCVPNQGVLQRTSPMGDCDSPASSSQWHWQCQQECCTFPNTRDGMRVETREALVHVNIRGAIFSRRQIIAGRELICQLASLSIQHIHVRGFEITTHLVHKLLRPASRRIAALAARPSMFI
jgi:hypothetical protein